MSDKSFEYSLKIVVVGEASSGKTCLVNRLIGGEFSETLATKGVDFHTTVVATPKGRVQLQLWDTAGQEVYRSVTSGYYRGAGGVIIVFDIVRRRAFESVLEWLREVRRFTGEGTVVMLFGTKVDLVDRRSVDLQEAKDFAVENGIGYVEVSARTGEMVEQAVAELVAQIQEKIESGTAEVANIEETTEVNVGKDEKKRCGC
jgi:small GTP-binding protein